MLLLRGIALVCNQSLVNTSWIGYKISRITQMSQFRCSHCQGVSSTTGVPEKFLLHTNGFSGGPVLARTFLYIGSD